MTTNDYRWLPMTTFLLYSDSYWLHSGYILATISLHVIYILPTIWLQSDCSLTTFWLHSDYILTTFWLHFVYFLTKYSDYILATFGLHSGYILTTFWLQSEYILTTFYLHSEYILTTCGLHSDYFWLFLTDWLTDNWSRTFDLLFQMIIDLKPSIDLRWLLDPALLFILRWSRFLEKFSQLAQFLHECW